MADTKAKKHLHLMRELEADRKHKAEEDMYRELDEQKDSEFVRQIATRRGGYATASGW